MEKYTIASVSCGKDSLVIPHEFIRRGWQLDEVVMYDTGMEFRAVYDTWTELAKVLDIYGIKHTVLRPEYDFCWQMFNRPVNVGKENKHMGYSWCGGPCRWGTTDKNLKELRNVYHHLPTYWERLKDLQRRTCRPMKGATGGEILTCWTAGTGMG